MSSFKLKFHTSMRGETLFGVFPASCKQFHGQVVWLQVILCFQDPFEHMPELFSLWDYTIPEIPWSVRPRKL